MATFKERLQQLEDNRIQRLSLLQAEKQLESEKLKILNENIAVIRSLEKRCLLLERRSADLGFQISAKRSEIEAFNAKYQASVLEFRVLKRELDELEVREKERDKFYDAKLLEMEEFKETVRRRVLDARLEVETMRSSVSKLRFTLKDLQDNDGYINNSGIAAAEKRNTELLAIKEDLDKSLTLNYQLRLLLQKQLQKILVSQNTRPNG
ncbi:uncharacterized protein A4U43_C01F18030 [Asparagus officinalis]|uniref:Uncharacterized protein n=1 Tax=Asparagus officinalis TaxID=4686 RepID=A0A5P1FSR0_ASPOF|nr:uncharacterized protein A4U43_C01F18030 [Asparagus officinalis]